MLQTVKTWWSRWRAEHALQHEFDGCSSFDIERIAQDIGMSAAELRKVAASGNSDLLFARLSAAGIDRAVIDATVLRDLQRCCGNCDSKMQCAHELEDKPVAARWPAYCPNEQTIDALTSMKCH